MVLGYRLLAIGWAIQNTQLKRGVSCVIKDHRHFKALPVDSLKPKKIKEVCKRCLKKPTKNMPKKNPWKN